LRIRSTGSRCTVGSTAAVPVAMIVPPRMRDQEDKDQPDGLLRARTIRTRTIWRQGTLLADASFRLRLRDSRRLDSAPTRTGSVESGDRPAADLDRTSGRRAARTYSHGRRSPSTWRLRSPGPPAEVGAVPAHSPRGGPAAADVAVGDDGQARPARGTGTDRTGARRR